MEAGTTKRTLLSDPAIITTRRIAGWGAIVATISLLILTVLIYEKYPYPYYAPSPPAAPRWIMSWRNVSFVIAIVAALISLPKWQSVVALLASIVSLLFYVVSAG